MSAREKNNATPSLTIGQVAERSGVRTDTVRYYERRGLIPRARRRASGYRDFSDSTVQQIRFIKRAQELGFTLEEIEDLLALRISSGAKCGDVMGIATHKMELIEDKISDLRAMRSALKRLLSTCQEQKSAVECPIIESLERSETKRKGRR